MIDFWATWCGPCKMISPIFERIASTVGDKVQFAKVDVDEQEQISQECGIKAMPTFIFFKNGEKVESVVGADPSKLQVSAARGRMAESRMSSRGRQSRIGGVTLQQRSVRFIRIESCISRPERKGAHCPTHTFCLCLLRRAVVRHAALLLLMLRRLPLRLRVQALADTLPISSSQAAISKYSS